MYITMQNDIIIDNLRPMILVLLLSLLSLLPDYFVQFATAPFP